MQYPRTSSACALLQGILILLTSVCGAVASADVTPGTPTTTASQAIAPLAAAVDDADARSQTVAAGAHSPTISDDSLRTRMDAIPAIQSELRETLAALEPREQAVDAKLAELGRAPAAGEPAEDPEVTQERRDLLQARHAIDTEIKLGGLVSIEVQQLQDYLVARRRSLLAERLWRQDLSPLDPRFWGEALTALSVDSAHVERLFATSLGEIGPSPSPGGVLGWAVALLAALGIAVPLRIALIRSGTRWARSGVPTRLRRSLLALWLVTISFVTALLACLILRTVLPAPLLQPPFNKLVASFIRALVFASLFAGLGRALLAPTLPAWRPAPLSDPIAQRLKRYPVLIGLAVGAATLLNGAAQTLGLSEPAVAAIRCLGLIVEIGVIGAGLYAPTLQTGRPTGDAPPKEITQPPHPEARIAWVAAAVCAWLAILVGFLATLLGYLALATFIIGETIWIATLLAVLFLLVRLVDDLFPALAAPHGRAGTLLRASVGLTPRALEQVGVLLSGVARMALLLFGWAAILAPLSTSAGDILESVTSADLAFRLGRVAVSPGTIIGGLLVFVVAIAITRGVRRWLDVRYLPKTALDVGARTALSAGVGYGGAIVAIVIAASYLGVSLDRITLFASALSVGIGFGLQAVIGNFVSGLILLAERPIKVGDWIAIGDLEGDVKRISVRATEIEMRDRSKLIVPNSDLISKTVRNVTRGSSLGRLKIVLQVDDDTDAAMMRSLLTARLQSHAKVLLDPPPDVFLTDVRDGALEFTAFGYVASPRDAYRVRSELLFEIVPELKANGISLANSTPVVNVGLGDRPIEPASDEVGTPPR